MNEFVEVTNTPVKFNLAEHLLAPQLTQARRDQVAIILARCPQHQQITYGELWQLTLKAARLLADGGVQRGDRVLIALPDGLDFVVALFGALAAGAVVVMANPEAPGSDLRHVHEYVKARAVLAHASTGNRMALAVGSLVFTCGSERDDFMAKVAASPEADEVVATSGDDDAFWLLTSGSTGAPKAAMHRHKDFAAHIQCYAKPILKLTDEDTTLAVPKLHFPYATGMNLLFPLAVGAKTILFPERRSPAEILDLMQKFGPTVFSTVPTALTKMLALPACERRPLDRLRVAVSAGEALPPHLLRRWQQDHVAPLLDGLGSAEMFHVYVSNRLNDVRPGGLGLAVPGYETRVVLEHGHTAPPGEIGSLWVRGPSAARGYHADAERSASTFLPEGWVVTGDMFRKDAAGYHQYEGRADDLFKVAGLYVSPLEVEAVLRQHKAVEDCAVVGCADADGLIKPKAFVVLSTDQTDGEDLWAELARFCRQHLLGYKVPLHWQTLAELPRNDRGKLIRHALR